MGGSLKKPFQLIVISPSLRIRNTTTTLPSFVLSVVDLYYMWLEMKNGDKVCGERGWKYHFYHHEIKVEPNRMTGKPEFFDYVTPGKVYRRGNKVFFKAVSE